MFLTDWQQIGGSKDPLGSINLLEWLTEFRGKFYSLDYWVLIKGYNSETVRRKRYIGQGMGEGGGAAMPSLSATLPESRPVHQLEAL